MSKDKVTHDDTIVLYNEDGTIAGYAWEPSPEYKAAVEAWLVPNMTPKSGMPKWETKF